MTNLVDFNFPLHFVNSVFDLHRKIAPFVKSVANKHIHTNIYEDSARRVSEITGAKMPCVGTNLRKTEFGGFTRGFFDSLILFGFGLNFVTLPLSFSISFFFLADAAVFPRPTYEVRQLFGHDKRKRTSTNAVHATVDTKNKHKTCKKKQFYFLTQT